MKYRDAAPRAGRYFPWLLAMIIAGIAAAHAEDASAPASRTPAQSVPAKDTSDSIEEIVVTARKRNENLIDTPVAVQFLGADQLLRTATQSLSGIADQVPQLHIVPFSTGGGGSIAIRGIGSGLTDNGVESSVSMVFDGVQLSRGVLSQLGLFDIDNVQVLKGPQALFFGKNSPAGVIAVNSKSAPDTWQADVHAGYEFNAQEFSIDAAFGGPITDTLKIRVSGKFDEMQGYLTNSAQSGTFANPLVGFGLGAVVPNLPATFSVTSSPRRKGPNDRAEAGRVVLDWQPTDDFSAALHVMTGQLQNDTAQSFQLMDKCAGGTALPIELGVTIPTGQCNVGTTLSLNHSLPQFRDGRDPYSNFGGGLSSLQLNYKLGKLDLTSVTGFSTFHNNFFTENSNLGLFNSSTYETYRQVSEELRARSNFDFPVNFVAGIYYESFRHRFMEDVNYFAGLLPVNPTNGRYDGSLINSGVDGKTYSPFIQAIWKIRDDLELDAGARYTHETRSLSMYNSVVNPYLPFLGFNVLPVNDVLSGSQGFNNVSPEATLTWHPQAETTLYAAFKTGYKSGGFSTPANLVAPPTVTVADYSFRPEKSSGGEVGFKGRFLDGSVQFTSAIYDYKFDDLQESEFNSATLNFSTQNAASATTKGVESDLLWRAMRDLTLHLSLNYNKGRFDSFPNAPCYAGQATGCSAGGTQDLGGTRLPFSSDWTEVVGFTWDQPLTGGYRLALGSNAQYLSAFNTSSTESSNANFGPIWLVDANLGIYTSDASSWRVELTGRNLLNVRYIAVSFDRTGAPAGTTDQFGEVNRPRELWLQLTKHFGH
jgi:iron complex outermembrane recepter protein